MDANGKKLPLMLVTPPNAVKPLGLLAADTLFTLTLVVLPAEYHIFCPVFEAQYGM